MGGPKTIINGVQELVGAQPEARLMAAIREALVDQKGRNA